VVLGNPTSKDTKDETKPEIKVEVEGMESNPVEDFVFVKLEPSDFDADDRLLSPLFDQGTFDQTIKPEAAESGNFGLMNVEECIITPLVDSRHNVKRKVSNQLDGMNAL